MGTIAALAESLLGAAVVSTTPVAGGDICTTTRLRLSDGRNAIIKTRPRAPAEFFAVEGAGLSWLREAGGVAVPEVYAAHDDCLILEWIEPGRPSAETAERFARGLAATHRAGAQAFGAERDGYIGLAPLPNRPSDTWAEFFAVRRVMPYVRAAVDRAALSLDEAALIETLMRDLDEYAGPEEPPSRIHGDLWSGNVVWGTHGHAYVVDPAAHGGHRETDLAMLSLFGVPFLERILDAYDEEFALTEGWRERVGLHQLHPLLVHAVLFGGSYGSRAAAAARAVLNGKAEH